MRAAPSQRVVALDGLRGLAALAVVLGHIAVGAASYRWIERPSIRAGNRVCVWLANAFGGPARPSRRFAEAAGASGPAAPSP